MRNSTHGTQHTVEKQDIKSIGLILYTLVTGKVPATEDGGSFSFDPETEHFSNLSTQCMDLVSMLLRDSVAE